MANFKAKFHEHLARPCGVKYDEEMNICLLESDLKMSKSYANAVSFDEDMSYFSTSMNLYERNEHFFFFMNNTAIELTGQILAPLYNINLKMARLITQTIVINITRCVSLAVAFDLLSFYFPSLADYISFKIQHLIKQDLCSMLCSLFFISSCPHSTDIE